MFVLELTPECPQSQRETILHEVGLLSEDTTPTDPQRLRWIITADLTPTQLKDLSGTQGIARIEETTISYPLVSRQYHEENSTFSLGEWQVGSADIGVIAGPCAVESREQIIESAFAVKEAGGIALRGGAYKPRTSPHSFQGHGIQGLQWLAEAREKTGLPIVTEVMDTETLPWIVEYADVLQVGTRNMQNFSLLRALGRVRLPVLLKRAMHCTLNEFVSAAEYILQGGNEQVMLCERGIRTFTHVSRNTFDANLLPILKDTTHLPVVADPSHAVGDSKYVDAIARCAIAAGADGLAEL